MGRCHNETNDGMSGTFTPEQADDEAANLRGPDSVSVSCCPEPIARRGVTIWCGKLTDYLRTPAPLASGPARTDGWLRVLLTGAGSVGTSVAGMLVFCPAVTGEAIVLTRRTSTSCETLRYPRLLGARPARKRRGLPASCNTRMAGGAGRARHRLLERRPARAGLRRDHGLQRR